MNNDSGSFVSTYSTWGPTFEGGVKPQFGSPGGIILSTYPVALGSYAVESGTSMATPLAAAIFALIAEVRGTLDPATIENLLAGTALPKLYNTGAATGTLLAPVAQQGAGLIQAYAAAHAKTLLSVSSLGFNDTDHLVPTANFTIKNTGSEAITYALGSVGAATAYTFSDSVYPDPFPGLAIDDSYATVVLSPAVVTVPAKGEALVMVTVTPPAVDGSLLPVYSGYITLNATNGENLSLPYQGIAGSLRSVTVMADAWLSLSTDDTATPIVGDNSSFVIPLSNLTSDAVLPMAVLDMAFGSRLIQIEVIGLETGCRHNGTKNLGNIGGFPLLWMSRDAILPTWNGSLTDGTYAPAGKYKLAISALHIFGDTSNPSDYDKAETVAFNIRYT